MYTKEEKKALVKEFWIHFDNYCSLQPELSWRKKKWALHRTGIPYLDLKFDPGRKATLVMIELNHRDEDRRLEIFERLLQYKAIIEQNLEGEFQWELVVTRSSGQEVSRIQTSLKGVDIHRRSDWHMMFQFMAEKMNQLQQNFFEIAELIKDDSNIT
jgi:hypothetical protein